MIRAVLDTNVVVSAHLVAQGRQALIVELGLGRAFEWIVSEPLLAEYEEVLRRPRFGLRPESVARSMGAIREVVRLVSPHRKLTVTTDPDDNLVLECALEGGANYVVTGNLRHFPAKYRNIRIVSPRAFQLILAADLE